MSFLESTNHHILPEYNKGHSTGASYWKNTSINESMTDLNEELPVQTPSKPVSKMLPKLQDKTSFHNNAEEMMDCESTLATDSQDPEPNVDDTAMSLKDRHFDIIAMNVNNTIQELNKIYNEIGYSTTEMSIKKSEIFTTIEDTINNFTSSLQREKNNIENECEWLRQQIRIILAMVNDNNGERSLSLTDRGIVFSNRKMYEEGYKDDILTKLANIQNRKQNFYANSPFNITSTGIPQTDFSFESQYEYMLQNVPDLSLLQLKNKLNSTFLEVLKIFMKCFKKLNDQTIIYLDLHDAIGEYYSSDSKIMMLKTLPSREEAEQHKGLIEQFESTIKYLKLSKKDSKVEPMMNLKSKTSDEFAVIISSPRKAGAKMNNTNKNSDNQNENTESSTENPMNQLRDLNYRIIRVIRSLKFTKITNEFLSNIQTEIEHCEIEFNERKNQMQEIINKCFDHINILNLNEEQVISIQKQYDIANSKNDSTSNDGYFDIETLKFIQTNPKEFGLNDNHLNFVKKFSDILQKIRDAKQMKWDYYLATCKSLWTKLGETNDYISNFLNANSSLTDISLMNFKMELNRLYMRRSEFIENFIIDSRIEIEELWNRMYFADNQRECFKYYNYDVHDDDLEKEIVLSEHEVELSRLKKEYESKENILKMYTQLNDLIKDQNFLKDSSKDSSRLLSKNSCKILLNEEKIRKRIIKNMPKLVETLKSDVIKYNNEQLNLGNKPFTINGEDFFEKLLVVESDQLNQGPNRNSRNNKFRSNLLESPKKMNNNLRSSPLKPTNRSPIVQSKGESTIVSVNRTKGASPYTRKSPLKVSPSRSQQIIKKPINKHTKIIPQKSFNLIHQNSKVAHAINMSLSSNSDMTSSSSLESPIRAASRTNSNMSKFMDAHLQPLNSPLTFNNDETTRIFHDNEDNTNHSNTSKLSPLRFNTSVNIDNSNNKLEKVDFTPVQKYGFIDSSYIDDRENKGVKLNRYGLSPIQIIAIDNEDKENEDVKTRTTKDMTCDSSTIIGDDYQAWRDERIRQLNSLT